MTKLPAAFILVWHGVAALIAIYEVMLLELPWFGVPLVGLIAIHALVMLRWRNRSNGMGPAIVSLLPAAVFTWLLLLVVGGNWR